MVQKCKKLHLKKAEFDRWYFLTDIAVYLVANWVLILKFRCEWRCTKKIFVCLIPKHVDLLSIKKIRVFLTSKNKCQYFLEILLLFLN